MSRREPDQALRDEEGNIPARFLPVDRVALINVLLSEDGESMYVEDDAYWYGHGKEVRVDARTLGEFVGLAGKSPEQMYRFAKRYGLLGLCGEHRRPFAHARTPIRNQECALATYERIEDWAKYSRLFRKIVENRRRVLAGEILSAEEWKEAGASSWRILGTSIGKEKMLLSEAVNMLLSSCGIHPIITWRTEPQMSFGSYDRMTLFAALTMQLAMAVIDRKIAICSACHQTYEPKRRPHRGEANYCIQQECQRESVRNRVQRHRDRERDTRSAAAIRRQPSTSDRGERGADRTKRKRGKK